MSKSSTVKALSAQALVTQIKPILAGHDPAVQGAVLADLLSIWIAGHHAGERTKELHSDLIFQHFASVVALVKLAESKQ